MAIKANFSNKFQFLIIISLFLMTSPAKAAFLIKSDIIDRANQDLIEKRLLQYNLTSDEIRIIKGFNLCVKYQIDCNNKEYSKYYLDFLRLYQYDLSISDPLFLDDYPDFYRIAVEIQEDYDYLMSRIEKRKKSDKYGKKAIGSGF